MKGIKTSEIDVSPIHDQKRAGLGDNHIEQMNVVDFAVSDVDKHGNRAVNFHQCVKLDGSLGSLVYGPGENTQTQIDGGGVQSINRASRSNPRSVSAYSGRAMSIRVRAKSA